jgi:hypothetical protein
MPSFSSIQWARLEAAPLPELPAPYFCLWPEPVDHDRCFEAAGVRAFADSDVPWDADFQRLTYDLIACLSELGAPRLLRGELPVRSRWLTRQQGNLSDALLLATSDDGSLPCVVGFGDPARAALAASDGHPIYWFGGAVSLDALLHTVARGRECRQTGLDWSALWPSASPHHGGAR